MAVKKGSLMVEHVPRKTSAVVTLLAVFTDCSYILKAITPLHETSGLAMRDYN